MSDRATQVCVGCKARKKACDKQLPSCGYCMRRGIACKYLDGTLTSSACNVTVSNVLGLLAGVPSVVDDQQPCLPDSPPLSDPGRPATLDSMLYSQICRIIQSLDVSFDEVTGVFFQKFHPWLPIISPALFRELATKHYPPSSDFSVLLLSMILLIQYQQADTLYLTLKTLFAQIQAARGNQVALVQASILVAAYEHARGWTDTAYVSLGSCVRMAYCLGLNVCRITDDPKEDPRTRLMALEAWNVWWGIIMVESIVLAELPHITAPPSVDLIAAAAQLPSHLSSHDVLDFPSHQILNLASEELDTASRFRRQAQATILLNRVLQAKKVPIHMLPIHELMNIDQDLQSFLMFIIDELQNPGTSQKKALATSIAIRALFILHEHVLRQNSPIVTDEMRRNSHAALRTASRLVIDVAHFNVGLTAKLHEFPLCCAANIGGAKSFVESKPIEGRSKPDPEDVDAVYMLERTFCKKWRASNR